MSRDQGRGRERERERERGRETQNPKQGPGSELSRVQGSQSPTPGSNSEAVRSDLSRSGKLNQLSHPGPPKSRLLTKNC